MPDRGPSILTNKGPSLRSGWHRVCREWRTARIAKNRVIPSRRRGTFADHQGRIPRSARYLQPGWIAFL